MKNIHSQGLWVVFFVLTLLMIGSASLQGATVLYLTKILHFTDSHSYSLFAAYHAIIYAVSIIGGFLGQRFLTQKVAVISGLVIGFLAFSCLAIPNQHFLFLGLSLHAWCIGLVMPNIYDLLGKLYQKNAPGRDSAFTIAYTGMNLGALAGFMSAGFVMHYVSYTFVFLTCAVAFLIATVIFLLKLNTFPQQEKKGFSDFIYALLIIAFTAFLIFIMLHYSFFSRLLITGTGIIILLGIAILAYKKSKIDSVKSNKLTLFLCLSLISITFWALYMLQPTLLTLFIDRNVNREIGGFIIPTASIMSFNPIFMLILGPLLSFWWLRRNQQNKTTPSSAKFMLGMLGVGLAFASLAIGLKWVDIANHVSLFWIILFFFFLSIGEMIIAPAGYASIGILIEENWHSVALGLWQLMTGVGGAVSGSLAQLANIPNAHALPPQATNPHYFKDFTAFALIAIVISLISMFLVKSQRKIGV